MFSNFKYPILLFLASFILLLAAMLLKLLHWPGAQLMAIGTIMAQVIAINRLMAIFFKSRYPVVLFFSGFILFIIGLAFKIMHWPNAQLIIVSMIMLQIIVVAWLFITIIKTPKP